MTVRYVADTGVFVRCGGPDNEKYRRLKRAVRRADARLLVPRRVSDELCGSPVADSYGRSSWQDALDDGWVVVADELDYANSVVSRVMDETRRFIAGETNRDEDAVEKADAALVGLVGQLLQKKRVSKVVLLTTDKPLGEAAETLLPRHDLEGRIEYRYVGLDYLDRLAPDEFRHESE